MYKAIAYVADLIVTSFESTHQGDVYRGRMATSDVVSRGLKCNDYAGWSNREVLQASSVYNHYYYYVRDAINTATLVNARVKLLVKW